MRKSDISRAEGASALARFFRGPRGRLAARSTVAAVAAAAALVSMAMSPVPAPAGRAGGPDTAGDGRRPQAPPLGFSLARLVPPDALAFASVADVPAFVERLSDTGLARALRDKRVAPLVRGIAAGLPRELAELRALALLFANGLGPALGGEAAVALLDTPTGDGPAAPDILFLANVSGREGQARAFLGTTLSLRFVTGRIESRKIAGAEAVVCSSGGDTVAWCESGGLLAVATSERALAGALARRPVVKGAPRGLPSLPAFERGTKGTSLGGRIDYRAFADVERVMKLVFGERAARLSAAYGIAGLRTVALAGRVGASFREAVHLGVRDTPGAETGIVSALGGPPVTLASASRMPPETILAAFTSIDGSDLAKHVSDPQLQRSGPKVLRVFLSLLGQRSARRVLGEVRGETGVALWNEGHVGWFPRLAAVTTVHDAASAERTLRSEWQSMAKRMRGRFLSRHGSRKGDPSRNVNVGFVDKPEVFIPLVGSPAYGLEGSTLVAGTAATAVCRVLEESRGLAAAQGFRKLVAELPRARSAFVYVNVETLVERSLEPHAPAVLEALVAGLSGAVDRTDFPPGEAVARHLGAAGVSAARSRGGIRIDAETPTGLVAGVFVVTAFARSPRPAVPSTRTPVPAR
jgi:hypothetical protein